MGSVPLEAASREVLYQLQNVASPIALLTSKSQKLPCSTHHQTTFGFSDHGHATAPSELKKSFVSQDVHGSKHRVLVHFKYSSDVLGKWEALSWGSFAFGNGLADLRCDLVVQGHRF